MQYFRRVGIIFILLHSVLMLTLTDGSKILITDKLNTKLYTINSLFRKLLMDPIKLHYVHTTSDFIHNKPVEDTVLVNGTMHNLATMVASNAHVEFTASGAILTSIFRTSPLKGSYDYVNNLNGEMSSDKLKFTIQSVPVQVELHYNATNGKIQIDEKVIVKGLYYESHIYESTRDKQAHISEWMTGMLAAGIRDNMQSKILHDVKLIFVLGFLKLKESKKVKTNITNDNDLLNYLVMTLTSAKVKMDELGITSFVPISRQDLVINPTQ